MQQYSDKLFALKESPRAAVASRVVGSPLARVVQAKHSDGRTFDVLLRVKPRLAESKSPVVQVSQSSPESARVSQSQPESARVSQSQPKTVLLVAGAASFFMCGCAHDLLSKP